MKSWLLGRERAEEAECLRLMLACDACMFCGGGDGEGFLDIMAVPTE